MPNIQGALRVLQALFKAKPAEMPLAKLEALKRVEHPAGDFSIFEALHNPRSNPQEKLSSNEFNRRMIATEMQDNSQHNPTVAFYGPDNSLAGAYQLSPKRNETEIAYLLSKLPGLGTELLEHAYRASKQQAPGSKVVLSAIPGSEEFYRKQIQRGWAESAPEGVPKFSRYAQGGLAKYQVGGM